MKWKIENLIAVGILAAIGSCLLAGNASAGWPWPPTDLLWWLPTHWR